jgi:drug/metabolite transporter (DMT)-like permease
MFLGEVISITTLAGCALVVLATWLVTVAPRRALASAN